MADVIIRTEGTTLSNAKIENIATEETLKAMLSELKLFNTNIKDNQKKKETDDVKKKKTLEDFLNKHFGSGPLIDGFKKIFGDSSSGKSSGGAGKNLTAGAEELTESISGMAAGTTTVTEDLLAMGEGIGEVLLLMKAIDEVVKFMSDMAHAAGALTAAFADGQTKLSAYTNILASSFKDVPILGIFLELIADGVKILEGWRDNLFATSAIGANFNNSLIDMKIAAASTGQSMENFSKIVMANAENFSQFGSVMTGVNAYTKVARISINQFSSQLANLGISLDTYAEELPQVLAILGPAAKARGASDQQLANSALQLTTQFSDMAKVTGKSREQQAADLQKVTADAAWKLKFSQMSMEQQTVALKALNQVSSTMGETAASALKMKILGIVPLDEKLRILTAGLPGVTNSLDRFKEGIDRGSMSTKQMDEASADAAEAAVKRGDDMQTILNAAASGIGGTPAVIADIENELLANKQLYMVNGKFERQKYLDALENARKTAQSSDAIISGFQSFEKTLKDFGMRFAVNVIEPLLLKLEPWINNLSNWLENHPFPIDKFDNFIKEVGDLFLNLLGVVGKFTGYVSDHQAGITKLFDFIGDTLSGLGTFLKDSYKFIMDHMNIIMPILSAIKETFIVLGIAAGIILATVIAPFVIIGQTILALEDALKSFLNVLQYVVTTIKGLFSGNLLDTAGKVLSSVLPAINAAGFAGGTAGSGAVLQDFGSGTMTTLHGKEAVLTEQQLKNVVTNTTNNNTLDVSANVLNDIKKELNGVNLNLNTIISGLSSPMNELISLLDKNNKMTRNLSSILA